MLWMITDFSFYPETDSAVSYISSMIEAGVSKVSLRAENNKVSRSEIINIWQILRNRHGKDTIFLHNIHPSQAPENCREFHFKSDMIPDLPAIRDQYPHIKIAVSTHSSKEYKYAFYEGANAVFYSPLFTPFSKKTDRRPTVSPIKRKNLYLLGGINTMRAAELIRKGYLFLSGISLFHEKNAGAKVKYLVSLMNHQEEQNE